MSNITLTPLQTWEIVAKAIPLSIVILFVILGNLLVIIVVLKEKNLRTHSNILILSLAVADLCVGVLHLPLAAGDILMGFHEMNRWYFGVVLCRINITIGYTSCSVSILHLVAISIDRYRIVKEGTEYTCRQNIRKSVVTCIGLWIMALWMSSAPIFGWNSWERDDQYDDEIGGMNCALPSKLGYILYLTLGACVAPGTVMITFYIKLFNKIKKRYQERLTNSYKELGSNEISEISIIARLKGNTGLERKLSKQIEDIMQTKVKFSLTKEKKAAKTLGIIIGAFIFCLTPFAIVYVTIGVCSEMEIDCVPRDVIRFVSWLVYCNSALNPIIYNVYDVKFREAFKRLLHLGR